MPLSLKLHNFFNNRLSTSLLFDLDGTLTDSKDGIINSVLYSLQRLGIYNISQETLISFIGPPLRESFTKSLGLSHQDSELAVQYYREYYMDKGMYENSVYEGIPELLTFCKKESITLYVATAKPEHYAGKIIEHFNLDSYFKDICGCTLDATRDNKTAVIGYVLQKHGLYTDNTIMIGDREHDINGAHSHNVRSIAVGYGYGTRKELQDCNPSYYAVTVKELQQLISTFIIV